ncbi:unnamed protein product [Microthlaspi erraticum]|uniref:Glutaredoxin domain-containing protein n=1 Tax=Microthlaspi erraticum TaxID=1685480 RepID=A0A6D2LDT1_9BRAS|nr:unnamed protein product [Microthlaspi erraticum]
MGCVSSSLLNPSDDFSQLAGCSHHFVKLTSSTYGLLNLDPPPPSAVIFAPATPMTPPERFSIVGKEPVTVKSEPEVISFQELMSGLDAAADACRLSPLPAKCNVSSSDGGVNKENSDPNWKNPRNQLNDDEVLKPLDPKFAEESESPRPPPEENRVVIYTTSLRGVRRTFEACNAVRAAIESYGVVICERDVSMDKGFREELKSLMAGDSAAALPRVFVKGKYIGGAEEVMELVEDGMLGDLLIGIPKKKDRGYGGGGGCCDGCGGLSFLPCSGCNGSCKVVEGWGSDAVVVKCTECNENGLVRCPICS